MGRILAFFYGLLAYVVFLAAFLYAIGFIAGLVVPKTIDTGAVTPVVNALVIDILLLSLFAVQHSVMARTTFKRWWTQFVPAAIERSASYGSRGTVVCWLVHRASQYIPDQPL